MSKKLLSVLLALALLVSSFAISAFAGMGDSRFESEEDAPNYKQTWALEGLTDDGNGTYTVDVRLTANYDVGPIQFTILKKVTAGTLEFVKAESKNIPAKWEDLCKFTPDDIANGKYSADDSHVVAIFPYPSNYDVPALNCSAGVVVATLTFKGTGDVAATLALDVADAKSANNPYGTLIAARMENNNVVTDTAITGQTVTNESNPTVTIGNASTPPELIVLEGKNGIIDISRKDLYAIGDELVDGYLYGVEPEDGDTVNSVFDVVGDGTINVIPTENGEGTGTIVQVLDLDGNVVAEYVLIIFGDVTGDGGIFEDDGTRMLLHDVWGYYENGASGQMEEPILLFAGDVTGDGGIYEDDGTRVLLHDVYGYYENGAFGRLLQSEVIASLA